MSSLSDRISLIVKKSGLTKTAFASRINVSQPLISRICSGEANPSDRTISDICREFHVDEVWLRTGVGEMRRPVSRSDEIAAFVGSVAFGNGIAQPVQSAVLAMLSRLTESEWELLAAKIDELHSLLHAGSDGSGPQKAEKEDQA